MKLFLLFTIAVISCSCETTRYLVISDGSKADGTITMMHPAGGWETSVVQWDDALVKAKDRCKEWGYTDARFFETYTRECTGYDQYGNCNYYNVFYKCQCISPIANQIDTISVKTKEPAPIQVKKTKVERLREIKQLLDEGILTQEEYNKEKEKILNEVE
jgi:hypothetical protein